MGDAAKALRRNFELVYQQIGFIRDKIHLKGSFLWIIEWHKHSVEELLDSEHHKKIHSIAGKIGDDVAHWNEAGTLEPRDHEEYLEHRHQVEVQLNDVNHEIEVRQPTWWEKLSGALISFVSTVMGRLPLINQLGKLPLLGRLLDRLPLPRFMRSFLGLEERTTKRIPERPRGE